MKEKFKSAIQNYADVERESREKSRIRMERSVLVLNPNLSQQEVIDVVRNAEGGGEDMFSSAVRPRFSKYNFFALLIKNVCSSWLKIKDLEELKEH